MINREFYIINNLIIKVFIEINIIKLKIIIINFSRDIIKIDIYKNLKIFIIIITRDFSINIIIYNNKKIIIFLYFNIIILVIESRKKLFLLENRDFIFKS